MNFFATAGCAIAAIPVAGLLYQSYGKWADRRRFPPPGRIARIGKQRFHIVEKGAGPTVVLEAGIASTSLAWVNIQRELAKEANVIAYDRTGFGWSSRARGPRTLDAVVEDLHAVLREAHGAPPYLLVGHSYGGLIVLLLAKRHPELVSGVVLVDAVNTCDWSPLSDSQSRRLHRGVVLSRRGAILARFGVVRLALSLLMAGNSRLPQLISRWSAGNGASVPQRLTGEVRKLPREVWPMVRMHWSDEKCFQTMAEYLERLPRNAESACDAGWPTNVPIIAITVPVTSADFPAGVEHRIANKSGHWIQLDEPDVVLQAIRELLARQSVEAGP
ncbi:MAG TPA: alpha/beta hydrolase [Bryobacteraceae bacterium]|nr:alpha/beta hydrolase [Bryobacteraceae bacterium]